MGSDDDDYPGSGVRYNLNSRIMLTAIVCLLFVIVVIVTLHLYARFVLKRQARRREALRHLGIGTTAAAQVHTNEQPRTGLDAAVIATLPIFVYKGADHIECAVCLSNLEEQELVRLLPNCKHTFHSHCIDTWLGAHSTCPVCRTEAEPRAGQPAASIELGAIVVQATAPPINSSMPCSEIGTTSDGVGQSSKTGSSSRLSSFKRMLSREKSEKRLQTNDQTDCVGDLERQSQL
ncbi:Ring-h2 finger protein [Thalictrum thalictroides]|uniref:RING-type E3 ubiquitin transferase n=1 Tax=Thalictrum thalictroides TaxID=46969 RepID=A0A7J6UWZ9_THATH|nr:Ring-h2 finger protein [Thalictrum thalictroides]